MPVDVLTDLSKEDIEDITLTWSSQDDCTTKTIVKTLFIDANAVVDFEIASGTQCLPFAATFVNHSSSSVQSEFIWDFGDGSTSNESNPVHVYTGVGFYNVTLTIISSSGCKDTILVMLQDLVNTHPTPVAGFSIDVNETDICHSLVNFTDESVGAETFIYDFDDKSYVHTEQNPSYLYNYDGSHYPMQVAISEFGCRDTAYQELYIEPFSIYAPNTFTPDGNDVNNVFLPVMHLDVFEWKLEVYDRWGALIFITLDQEIGWSGTLPNGLMGADGTYLWKITYVSCEPINPRHVMTGHINLLR